MPLQPELHPTGAGATRSDFPPDWIYEFSRHQHSGTASYVMDIATPPTDILSHLMTRRAHPRNLIDYQLVVHREYLASEHLWRYTAPLVMEVELLAPIPDAPIYRAAKARVTRRLTASDELSLTPSEWAELAAVQDVDE